MLCARTKQGAKGSAPLPRVDLVSNENGRPPEIGRRPRNVKRAFAYFFLLCGTLTVMFPEVVFPLASVTVTVRV